MKKLLLLILSFAICIGTLNSLSVTATIKGDVNQDGKTDIKDLLILRKYNIGIEVEIDKNAADYNNDLNINITDIVLLRRMLAGLDKSNIAIDPNYKNVFSSNVQINQIGYELNAEKTAKLCEKTNVNKVDSTVSGVNCYLVNADDNTVVYSGVSSIRKYDGVTDRFVSTFDFSSVTIAGNYKIITPDGFSYNFIIKNNPYENVENGLITALYYNRCGSAISKDIVGENYAHDICHNGDTPVYILNKLDNELTSSTYGKYIQSGVAKASDFSGGLHDAGDYGRYTIPANQVVADLLLTYEMYGKKIDCKKVDNITSDLLLEAKYEMEWLLKMQNKRTGGVYWRIATKEFVEYGNRPDQDNLFNKTGLYVSHETLKATAGFVGAAAMCARVFSGIDNDFSEKCLLAAKSGYEYVKENMNDKSAHIAFSNSSEYPVVNAGAYGDNPKAWGEIWWATCELFRATGDNLYNNYIIDLYNRKTNKEIDFSLTEISAYQTGGVGAYEYINSEGADLSIKKELLTELVSTADSYFSVSKADKYNNILYGNADYQWGSNQIICVKLKVLAIVDNYYKTSKYQSAIRDSICYMLGRNAVNKCYITGYGSNSPLDICHAPSAYLRVKYNIYSPAPGFMVGGAFGSGEKYEDVHDNYACNEVCVYWNSSAILAFGYIVNYDSLK